MPAPWRLDPHVDRGNRKVKGARTAVRLNAVAERPRGQPRRRGDAREGGDRRRGRETRARGLRLLPPYVRGISGAIPC
jgi:hypothetical protein